MSSTSAATIPEWTHAGIAGNSPYGTTVKSVHVLSIPSSARPSERGTCGQKLEERAPPVGCRGLPAEVVHQVAHRLGAGTALPLLGSGTELGESLREDPVLIGAVLLVARVEEIAGPATSGVIWHRQATRSSRISSWRAAAVRS